MSVLQSEADAATATQRRNMERYPATWSSCVICNKYGTSGNSFQTKTYNCNNYDSSLQLRAQELKHVSKIAQRKKIHICFLINDGSGIISAAFPVLIIPLASLTQL